MDLSCIINSGDLELYVLGLLLPEERQKMEQLAQMFPEIRTDLNAISETLEQSGKATNARPSDAARVRILSAINNATVPAMDVATSNSKTIALAPTTPQSKTIPLSAEPLPAKRNNIALAAAVVGFLLSCAGMLWFASQNRENKNELAQAQNTVELNQKRITDQQSKLIAYNGLVAYLQNPDWTPIRLTPPEPDMPKAMVQVFWNKETHAVMVANISLPPAPTGHQYQLWAIVDGKPVDGGMMDNSTLEARKMKNFASAQAFAITLEKEGGSETPTMEAMQVMGAVG